MVDIAKVDYIIVGAGLSGSVIARKLAEYGKRVLIFERRNHIAGNMYDEIDFNGILVQRYGPHAFHTNNQSVFESIIKYDTWIDYHLKCAVNIYGLVSPSPFNFKTIDLLYGKEEAKILKERLKTRYTGQKSVAILDLLDCDDILIKQYAEKLFEMDYRPYTSKQWGIPPEVIDPSVLKRVPIRLDYTNAYFDDTYQILPQNGYTLFFKNLLAHENIELLLNTDILDMLKIDMEAKQISFENKQINIPFVYTGAIDELLMYRYGHLPYRSLRFDYQVKNVDSFQDVPVVVHPAAEGFTRITEYKKLPPQNISGLTTVAYEYPFPANEKDEPYYPIITDNNVKLYKKYRSELSCISNIILCGRLADYKYYNMDDAIMRAFDVLKTLL